MANLVVTSTATKIKVDFGAYSTTVGYNYAYFSRNSLSAVKSDTASSAVLVECNNEKFMCAYATSGNALIVDSVDGVAPTSNVDLCDKIAALMV